MRLISTSRRRSVGGDWVSRFVVGVLVRLISTIRCRGAGETGFHDSLSKCW